MSCVNQVITVEERERERERAGGVVVVVIEHAVLFCVHVLFSASEELH